MLSAPHLPRGSENSLYFILYINIHLDVGLSLSRLFTLTHTHRSALEARVFQLDVPSHDGCIVRGQPTPTSARTLHRAQIRYIMPPYIPIVPKYIPSCPHHTGTAALHSGDGSYAPYTSAWTSPGSYRAVHVAPLTCKRYPMSRSPCAASCRTSRSTPMPPFPVASVNLPPSQVGAAQLGARPRRRVGSSGARLSNMSEAWYLWGVRFRVQRSAFRVQDLGLKSRV
mmetsp:Transcript_9036/g.14348  ORF Transcript_9036/g.14348 Transcript_9036/m.14348 type:complete len:226 (-) Transcript_9036:21-698(-)